MVNIINENNILGDKIGPESIVILRDPSLDMKALK